MKNDILVVEISGKRPGTSKDRETEKFSLSYDHVIISNNSEGYITDWPIVNVPDDYKEWYVGNVKSSDNAWYAPMNRTYAIKYAKEHGYKYLVQADDNIQWFEIANIQKIGDVVRRRRMKFKEHSLDPIIEMLHTVLENSNAVMAGCELAGLAIPECKLIREAYCYSFFMLKLDECPDIFQGDFEDDIEYRLKCHQMSMPVVQVVPIRYSKTGQKVNKDLSGCRAEYAKVGLRRGEHMMQLYGDIYSCTMRRTPRRMNHSADDIAEEPIHFKHQIKPFKDGIVVYDMGAIRECFDNILRANMEKKPDKYVIKTKKVRKSKDG